MKLLTRESVDMKTSLLGFIALFLLIGCATSERFSKPKMTNAERNQAINTVVNCAFEKIPLYDDGISPAQTIAHSIAVACYDEIEALRLLILRGQSDAFVIGFMSGWDMMKPTITGMVLQYRVSQK